MTLHEHDGREGSSTGRWVLIGFLAITGFFLFTEHRAHVFGVLPFLLLLACPLMHIFMHGGHGGHSQQHDRQQDANPPAGPAGRESHPHEDEKGGQP